MDIFKINYNKNKLSSKIQQERMKDLLLIFTKLKLILYVDVDEI